jgi:hypothetical protein
MSEMSIPAYLVSRFSRFSQKSYGVASILAYAVTHNVATRSVRRIGPNDLISWFLNMHLTVPKLYVPPQSEESPKYLLAEPTGGLQETEKFLV